MKEKIQAFLQKVADWTEKNEFLQILQGAFALIMPLTLIGSLFTLLNGLPITAYQNFITSIGIKDALAIPYNFTYGYFSIYVAFAFAYTYARKKGLRKDAVILGVLGIVNYLIVCPDGDTASWIGTLGIFSALVIAYLTAFVYKKIIDKKIVINMPESVPPAVAQSFVALIPSFVTITLALIIHIIFMLTPLVSFPNAVYVLARLPISALTGNIFGEIMFGLYVQLLWFFGIHGGMTVMPIMSVVFMQNQVENLAAYNAGTPLPHMFTGGGIGFGYWSIALAFIVFSKNKGPREIGKLGLIPSIFTISEPLVFGVPIILNTVFFIPYVILPVFFLITTHLLQVVGFLSYANGAQVAWVLPDLIQDSLIYGWKGVVVGVVFNVINFFAWSYFIKLNDRQLAKQTQAAVAE